MRSSDFHTVRLADNRRTCRSARLQWRLALRQSSSNQGSDGRLRRVGVRSGRSRLTMALSSLLYRSAIKSTSSGTISLQRSADRRSSCRNVSTSSRRHGRTFHGDDVGWKLCLHCAVHITAYWIWCMVVCCVIVELMASVSHADIIATMMS